MLFERFFFSLSVLFNVERLRPQHSRTRPRPIQVSSQFTAVRLPRTLLAIWRIVNK